MLTFIILITVFIGFATLVGGVALMFGGGRGSTVADRLQVLTSNRMSRGPQEQEASVLNHPLDEGTNVVEQFVSRFLNLRVYLDQGNISLSASKFLLICGGLGLAGGVACLAMRVHLAIVPFVALTMSVLPFGWAWWKRKRRLKKFGAQLPDALELVARALRSGHSLAAGFHLVGEEVSDPLGEEFARVYEEQNLGIPLEEALENMVTRVPNLDLRFFATAVTIQRQSGGDLAEILDKIGHLVRERFKIWGQVQALTGEGRLSGVVLLGLPPVLFVTMLKLNPGYVMMLFEDPMGKQMLAAALVLQAVGALVIRKIVNIRV